MFFSYNYLFRFFLYSVFNEHFRRSSRLVGPSGLEPPTSCLSGTRSNLLSYEPMWLVSDFSHLVLVTVNSFEYYLFTLHYYLLHCKQSLRGGDDVD